MQLENPSASNVLIHLLLFQFCIVTLALSPHCHSQLSFQRASRIKWADISLMRTSPSNNVWGERIKTRDFIKPATITSTSTAILMAKQSSQSKPGSSSSSTKAKSMGKSSAKTAWIEEDDGNISTDCSRGYGRDNDRKENDNRSQHHDVTNSSSMSPSQSSSSSSSSGKTRSWTSATTTITGKWREQYLALQNFQQQHGHTRVPYNYRPDPSLGRWVHRQRSLYHEMKYSSSRASVHKSNKTTGKTMKKMRYSTVLSQERIQALKDIGFSFDSSRKRSWNKRFDDLCLYRALHGDCLVPLNYEDIPGLGVWVRNQRTQYRNLLLGRRKQSHLSPDKIAALQSIGFVWDTQRNDQWKKRFDELVDFKEVYGHCSVPEKYHENQQLGTWVANQRTSYKNFFAGNSGLLESESQLMMGTCTARGLTKEKIAALESIGFCWDQTTYNWYSMYERLKQYKQQRMQQQNHESSIVENNDNDSDTQNEDDNAPTQQALFHVPPEDVANRDLRLWIAVQRKEYSNYMHNKNNPQCIKKRTSMTPRRIRALDAINFPWSANKQKYAPVGPTVDDWTKLFEKLREQGIDKNAKPKEHWFEGESLLSRNDDWNWNKDQWTDEDLLKLWNMEDDE
jgi:Helicase associated domain.